MTLSFYFYGSSPHTHKHILAVHKHILEFSSQGILWPRSSLWVWVAVFLPSPDPDHSVFHGRIHWVWWWWRWWWWHILEPQAFAWIGSLTWYQNLMWQEVFWVEALGYVLYAYRFNLWITIEHCVLYNRLAGISLVVPFVSYWWPHLPRSVSREAFKKLHLQDQWTFRVARYAPWLFYWWMTQKWFPSLSLLSGDPSIFSSLDVEILKNIPNPPKVGLIT